MANVLEQQDASPFRVNAYRQAATTLEGLKVDVATLVHDEGLKGLEALPHIGRSISKFIEELIRTGRSSQLDRLRGSLDPVRLFSTIPGIGSKLASTLHDSLSVETLEELEVAAHDGRLESVPGVGKKRATAIRDSLASQLARARPPQHAHVAPAVATLLDVDREYRSSAATGKLRTIAPRRFNPQHKAWLPVLHTERSGWHFTLLFSNTARAHQLGKTRDWVIVYYADDDHNEGQCTIVTEHQGPKKGQRVVRGRENE